jgi:hypothetical protein
MGVDTLAVTAIFETAMLAEGVRFELTREHNPLPVFKTGALNHSATLPGLQSTAFLSVAATAQAVRRRIERQPPI